MIATRPESTRSSLQSDQPHRRGAMIVMMLFLLTVVLAMVVFTVDTAYMQLVRTELRAATDAAARAGAAALSDSGGDIASARSAAIAMAAQNNVGGKALTLSNSDIEVGNSVRQPDGTWAFTPGASPRTAVRVTANMSSSTSAGPVNLLFGSIFNTGTFSPRKISVASQMDQDVVLCVDRSHSMCFDESGVDWQYPLSIPSLPYSLKHPPHPVFSRWASLQTATSEFCDIVGRAENPPQLSLVTWGSKITLANFEGNYTGKTFNAVDLDCPWSFASLGSKNKILGRGKNIMLGGTNMAAGLDAAIAQFSSPSARPLAKKVIVLMTDGQWNQGRNPLESAAEAKAAGIVVHTVTFLEAGGQPDMKAIATLTGGKHYHATDGAELINIFKELAMSLPVALTD